MHVDVVVGTFILVVDVYVSLVVEHGILVVALLVALLVDVNFDWVQDSSMAHYLYGQHCYNFLVDSFDWICSAYPSFEKEMVRPPEYYFLQQNQEVVRSRLQTYSHCGVFPSCGHLLAYSQVTPTKVGNHPPNHQRRAAGHLFLDYL